MKRYIIPIIAIVLVGTATYFWTSRVSARKAMLKARYAHLDSLRAVQSKRLTSSVLTVTMQQSVAVKKDSVQSADTNLTLNDLWVTKHLSAMPDSIRPQDFKESRIKYVLDEEKDGDEGVNFVRVFVNGYAIPGYDTAASKIRQRNYWFLKHTVMAMLTRHLKNTIDPDQFSRCPSGYFFTTNDYEDAKPRGDMEWDSGSVYFDVGCDDTVLCDFRFIYAKRIVEIKDINSSQFQSLREYEVAKFGEYADTRRVSMNQEAKN